MDAGDGGHMMEGGMMSCAGDLDEYMPGLEKDGINGTFTVVLVESDPEPGTAADNGDYEWTIRVLDAGGDVVTDADVNATPMLPAMGHGTPVPETVTNNGDGTYSLTPLNLFMGGRWVVTIDIEAGGETDNVEFAFCIPGGMMGMDGGMMGMDGSMMGMDGSMMGMDGG
jgi:hypothetical protein